MTPKAAPKPKVTPKQDELNKDINIENEILVSPCRKRDLEQSSESDRREILTRQAILKRLNKELKEVIQNATRQERYAMKGHVNSRVWTKRHVKS